jgi:spore germination protein KA
LTISFPAIFIALTTFHQEMVPTPLIKSISAARQSVPFPTGVETFILLVAFEILREAGTRMPTNIGQALSIVGALVLGQAAVEARIVSAPIVIVVALTAITGLCLPRVKGAEIILRFLFLLLSSIIGLYGFNFGVIGLLIHLFSIRSFGVPYMLSISTYDPSDIKDTLIRAPWIYMKYRPKFIAPYNRVRNTTTRGKKT